MSDMRHKRYLHASDALKAALVNYCHEVRMTAPELADKVKQFESSVLKQDIEIASFLTAKVVS